MAAMDCISCYSMALESNFSIKKCDDDDDRRRFSSGNFVAEIWEVCLLVC